MRDLPRAHPAVAPTSQGVDRKLFGNRNTPTAMYAAFSPEFHFDDKEGIFVRLPAASASDSHGPGRSDWREAGWLSGMVLIGLGARLALERRA